MRCFIRFDTDSLDNAEPCASLREACDTYADTARELDLYGQECKATVHFARTREELAEYPDRLLTLSARGAVQIARC